MMAHDIQPDGFTHAAILSTCSHADLVEEGCCHFMAINQNSYFIPSVMHYNCIVDLLGRAGYLHEGKLFIANIPIEPNVVT
jgi:hypothetical protein